MIKGEIMIEKLAYKKISQRKFNEIVDAIEKNSAENMFRVLHIHDVQATLAEKGFERSPLKIIEVCNAGFANQALNKSLDVAIFMPCKIVVAQLEESIQVTLVRPEMIADFMPEANVDEMAAEVELTLKKVLDDSI
jgi:uncharacterized protein (DUF302 family)